MTDYFTLYDLQIEPEEEELFDILFRQNSEAKYALDDGSKKAKWYTHEDDLKDFSKRHQDYLFILSGDGDESGDMWIKYFKNGKMQFCPVIITFDEFDERKLK